MCSFVFDPEKIRLTIFVQCICHIIIILTINTQYIIFLLNGINKPSFKIQMTTASQPPPPPTSLYWTKNSYHFNPKKKSQTKITLILITQHNETPKAQKYSQLNYQQT